MSLFKKLAALTACSLSLWVAAAPQLSPHYSHNSTVLHKAEELSLLNATYTPKRLIIFGDSLSEIGNTQMLLEVLNGKQNPSIIFKPLNEDNSFKKLLNYFHLPLPDVKIFEDAMAKFFISILDLFHVVPILPDHYYYNGPEHKSFGRFSNGPNWSEWLGQMILDDKVQSPEHYINRAYGGSWASRLGQQKIDWTWNISKLKASIVEYINGKLLPPDMHSLVSAFISMEHPQSQGGEMITVLYGANDYLNNDYTSKSSKSPPRIKPVNVVRDITEELVRLADWASKAPKNTPLSYIYIANLPKMSLSPRYQTGGGKGQGRFVDADIVEHNRLLEDAYHKLAATPAYQGKVMFRYIDTFGIFNDIYQNSPATNKTEPCYLNDMLSSPYLIKKASSTTTVKPCKDEEDYFFWDVVHPAKETYASLAAELCSMISKDIKTSCFTPHANAPETYPHPAFNP